MQAISDFFHQNNFCRRFFEEKVPDYYSAFCFLKTIEINEIRQKILQNPKSGNVCMYIKHKNKNSKKKQNSETQNTAQGEEVEPGSTFWLSVEITDPKDIWEHEERGCDWHF